MCPPIGRRRLRFRLPEIRFLKSHSIPFTCDSGRRFSIGGSDAFTGRGGTSRSGSCRRRRLLAAHELTEFDVILLRDLPPTHPIGAHLENTSRHSRGVTWNHLPTRQRRIKLLGCRLGDALLA